MEVQRLGQTTDTGSLLLRLLAGVAGLYLLNATGRALVRQFEMFDVLLPLALALSSAALWLAYRQVSPADEPTSVSKYRFRPWLAATVCFSMYVGWGALIHVTPISDFLEFYKGASAFAAEPNLHTLGGSKSPITVLAYSAFFALFGSSYFVAYVAAAALWAVQMPVLYYALVALGFDVGLSTLATVAYGFAPATVLYAPVLSSEAVFNFLLVLSLFVVGQYKRTAHVGYVIALSAACGLLFLTRANGLVFFVIFCAVCLRLAARQRLRIPIVSLALALPFTLLVGAQTALNYHHTGSFSMMPSRWGSYNLLAGTNRASGGGWNLEDTILAGFHGPKRVSVSEASANARRIAVERISDDPIGFVHFALTKKVARMWDTDAHGLWWSIAGSPAENSFRPSFAHRALGIGTDGFYILTLALATAFFLLAAFRPATIQVPAPTLFLLTAPLLLMGLLHLILECQHRYHVPLMPLIYAAAMLALFQLLGEESRKRKPRA